MKTTQNAELRAKIAHLESAVDLLESELSYLDERLVLCGFPEGVKTLKATVEELLREEDAARPAPRDAL
jgi:outer membrane murein-binding lipoprotein Lpp